VATVLDEVTAALKELGVLAANEVADAGQAEDGRLALNRLVDQWAAERLQIFTITRTTWTIATGVGTYTVGTGGTVNVARPVFLDHVNYIETSATPDLELQLSPLTDDAYAGLAVKALTATDPSAWYYNPTFPLGTLNLWPIPTSTTLLGALYAPQAVATFSALSTSVALPPGYERMIVKNLALEMAPGFIGLQVNPLLAKQAQDAVAVVKRVNRRLVDMSFPADALIGGGGSWSIYTGP
jgi:hypothetical protein